MKKVILFFALALACVTGAIAQKQTGGEKNLEVQFAPLGGSPISIDGIRLRIFTSESSAVRLRIGLGGTKNTTVNQQEFTTAGSDGQDVTIPALYDTDKTFNFSIRPGYEIHMAGTDKLSPYVGAELFLGVKSATLDREYYGPNKTGIGAEDFALYNITRKNGSSTIGFNLVAGVDYYIADNIYLGAELGFGLMRTKTKDVETEVSSSDALLLNDDFLNRTGDFSDENGDFNQAILSDDENSVEFKTIVGDGSGAFKTFGWGPSFQSTIRLGWIFN